MELPARRKHRSQSHYPMSENSQCRKMRFRFPAQQRIRYTNPLVRQNMHLIFQAESQMMRRYLASTRWQFILRSSVLECRGDEIAFNQQIIPTKYKSLILGRTFTVSVGTAGTHLGEMGYGTRDYRKYVKARQVRFPFPVVSDGRQIAADSWITILSESAEFLLPVSVPEGDYNISYRSIAINAEKI